MTDVLGAAIADYYQNRLTGKLWIHNSYGKKEEMPVNVYFRDYNKMPAMEQEALALCRGTVLDTGAGAGSHSLVLQRTGRDVTALDISPKAIQVMQDRGILKTVCSDIFSWQPHCRFDTLLLLMNGIGVCGTLAGLGIFLKKAADLLTPDGQLIFDSSDVAYLYNGRPPHTGNYYGEIIYQYEYKREKTAPFTWLYIDQQTLQTIASAAGWHTEIITVDEWGQYLAKLQRNNR